MNNDILKDIAINDYQGAVSELKDFCKKETNFACQISVKSYPIEIKLTPAPQQQMSMIDEMQYAVSQGDASVIISVGDKTIVTSNLKFRLDSPLLKKILKKSEQVASTYFHAFRCVAQDMLDTGDTTQIKELQEI